MRVKIKEAMHECDWDSCFVVNDDAMMVFLYLFDTIREMCVLLCVWLLLYFYVVDVFT